jgi:hypothetical protein
VHQRDHRVVPRRGYADGSSLGGDAAVEDVDLGAARASTSWSMLGLWW